MTLKYIYCATDAMEWAVCFGINWPVSYIYNEFTFLWQKIICKSNLHLNIGSVDLFVKW